MKKFLGKLFWHLCVGLYRFGTGRWNKLKIQPNKVIASSFGGRKFGDNPLYIYEALKELCPDVDLVWVLHVSIKLTCHILRYRKNIHQMQNMISVYPCLFRM